MGTAINLQIPKKLKPVFLAPRGSVRYRAAYGGRGSGKSFTFAQMALIFGYAEPLRILCTRELQVSIKESMHAELRNVIDQYPWLANHYRIGESSIKGANGTEFIFRGLRHNISAVKSMAQIDLCIIEEAEDVPESSWQSLEPTIRAPNSEIWVIWNPMNENSPVDARFIKNPPESAKIARMNYNDNPWLPEVLDQQRRRDREVFDDATYAHVWEGEYLENSDAQVLSGCYSIDTFEPHKKWDGPYFGLDWGFAQDPTAFVECYVHKNTLYIYREAGGTGIELDDTPALVLNTAPHASKYVIRADSARPECNSYVKRHGLPRIEGVKKWSGSVEDGIARLRAFDDIVIHENCANVIQEARLYSYKKDRNTGDVLPKVIDANNHYMDAIRYAINPMVGGKGYNLGNL